MNNIQSDRGSYGGGTSRISFSDVDCIKRLIQNRSRLDISSQLTLSQHASSAAEALAINEELICAYLDLQTLISRCEFSGKQRLVLERLQQGYTLREVGESLQDDGCSIGGILGTICRKIKSENDHLWKYDYVFSSRLPVRWEYKRCSKCGQFKPKTASFYSRDKRNSSGFQSACKPCEAYRKKRL